MEQPRIHTTILIKRRLSGEPGPPPTLNPGELAFNEVDGTLYIGTTNTNTTSSSGVEDPGFF
jgi:hypothetical protein